MIANFYLFKGDGIWGSICCVIGAAIGIAAGCINDYKIFKALYIAQATLVSPLVQGLHTTKFYRYLKNGIGVCTSLCATFTTGWGIAYSWQYTYYDLALISIWMSEGVFLLGKGAAIFIN